MNPKLIAFALVLVGISGGSAVAQTCLHGRDESPAERQRRQLALAAVRVINTAEANRLQFAPLDQLADAPAVRAMRAELGTIGDAARAMRFDRDEVLPGWRLRLVLGDTRYSIALRDTRDACGFTYVSNEDGEILQAYPINRDRSPIVPTTP